MNLTELAIRNNRLTWVVLAVIVFAGMQTYVDMPRAYDPGFVIRAAQVVVNFPGASPERVEKLVTSKVEEVIKEIPELDFVTSESRTGIAIVTANIKESYTEMRPIWDNLRRKVDDIRSEMPEGVSSISVNDEFGDVYGVVIGLTGEGFSYAELNTIAEDLKDELLRVPDASKVEIYGSQDERVFLEYNNARLSELGISPGQLSNLLSSRNIVISGGAFDLGQERITLEPTGNFESLEDIGKTVLNFPNTNQLLYLKDVAEITRGYVDPPSALLHISGTRGLAIGISMREGGNNIVLGSDVEAVLDRFEASHPWGIEFELINFSPAEVDQKVKDFVANLLQAILVVTVVMLISLGLRTGLVVSTLIPISMLLAMVVMSVFDIGLDQISLAALIISLGMLVDNGIVMSENIMVQMEKGVPAREAAVRSAQELRVPLLTASLTTAAAFLPIFLAESSVGEFTASLFKVVTITLLCSWLISLTIIPMLCVMFLRITPKEESFDSTFYVSYRAGLGFLLRHKWITLLATIGIFFIAMMGFNHIPKLFFPPSDRTYFKVELELPSSTSIEKTTRIVDDLENYIQSSLAVSDSRPEGITSWASYIGNAGPRFVLSHNPKPANSAYAFMILNVNSLAIIKPSMEDLQSYAMERHPDLDIKVRLIESGPSVANPVEVRLSSKDSDALFAAVAQLKNEMQRIGGLRNINDNWGQRIKKLQIDIDQERSLRAGVTSEDIAISLQAGLSGFTLTEFRENEDVIPVLLRSQVGTKTDIGKVESLSVYVQSSGQSLPLKQVADIELVWDTAKIFRRDGLRNVVISAQLQPGTNALSKFDELIPWLAAKEKEWGPQIRYELGGELESSGDANQSIMEKLPVAGFIILVLLVAQFNSIRKSLIILTTIPLALIGVIAGLLVGQSFMGFMTFLGIISLAGIVINNAIVLLERIQLELDNGLEQTQAIISAAQQRARPILLTTATTVLGLIPLYLGGGEMWEPMAISIMGGLLFSTALTLGVVPVLYALLYGSKASGAETSESQ